MRNHMKFIGMQKVRDGKYLKNYELTYQNLPEFYSKDQVKKLLESESFSSRAQIIAYFFAYGEL